MATDKKTTEIPTEAEEQIINAEATEVVEAKDETSTKNATKAGKRSTKGQAEAEAKAEKIEHQEHRAEEEAEKAEKPKQPVKPTRSRLERRSKGYRKAAEQVEKGKVYSLKDALELTTKTSSV
jgi:hypothetical protein